MTDTLILSLTNEPFIQTCSIQRPRLGSVAHRGSLEQRHEAVLSLHDGDANAAMCGTVCVFYLFEGPDVPHGSSMREIGFEDDVDVLKCELAVPIAHVINHAQQLEPKLVEHVAPVVDEHACVEKQKDDGQQRCDCHALPG